MSSSPLPVPRKVALTAVRGLLVGTSCTLALVAEDRRRKINNAIRVIENGEKIKSARNYHSSSEAGTGSIRGREDGAGLDVFETVLLRYGASPGTEVRKERKSRNRPLEAGTEQSIFGPARRETPNEAFGTGVSTDSAAPTSSEGTRIPSELPESSYGIQREANRSDESRLRSSVEPGDTSKIGRGEASLEQVLLEGARNLLRGHDRVIRSSPWDTNESGWTSHVRTTHFPASSVAEAGHVWSTPNPEILKSVAARTSAEVAAMVWAACRSPDPSPAVVSEAVQAFISVCEGPRVPEDLEQWIQASALLCRTCQDLSLVKEAEKVYRLVQRKVTLSSEDRLAHNPFSLIVSLIGLAGHSSDRDTKGAYLDTAVGIYTASLSSKPTAGNTEASGAGVALIEALFQINYVRAARKAFARCVEYTGKDQRHKLANWFMGELLDRSECKTAIDLFLARHRQFQFEIDTLDRMVQSVQQGHGYRADEVLKCLVKACSGTRNLHLKWIAKLFQAHWKRFHKFDRIEELFVSHLAPDLDQITKNPERVYRLMVEMALKADDFEKARSYLSAAATRNPEVLTDPFWLGLLATHPAKEDNWQAVRELFEEMVASTEERSEALATMFVPVLKLYAKTHQLEDIEEFVDLYTNQLNVPLCRYTVTFMMSQYAAAQDPSLILKWLGRCQAAHFKDGAIGNAILDACRKMKMAFRGIRTIYRKLQAMNPSFVDDHAERMMAEIALSGTSLDGNVGTGRRARGRVLSMRLQNTGKTLASSGRPVAEHDLILAMKDAMVIGGHAKALWIYKRALHNGLRPSVQVLRLAVRAELNMPKSERSSARVQELLRQADLHGQDIQYVTNQAIAISLKEVSNMKNTKQIRDEVRVAIAHFEGAGITLSDAVFNWAAHACMKAGHFADAIDYAYRAVDAVGLGTEPCYNFHNFRTLLTCFVELLDVGGVWDTIEKGLSRPYSGELQFKVALQQARRLAEVCGRASDVANASDDVFSERRNSTIHVITAGIARTVEGRSVLDKKRKRFEEEALQIMKQAALEAGNDPVDFETIPWLGGKASKTGDQEDIRPEVEPSPGTDPADNMEEVLLKHAAVST
ncbi:hypothetical protein QBC34DRAFT_403893 [Podospora aff. communis PSN243]|uniref:Uncharacterized protein n=1 Tax=Podospora aff. communis PSN243 TaxID=3040156 RepID=A0AAV9GNH3_9PEZI|nr:hypothetical protein QBC34DRAFT_403893 [Podospora aff. communis PSN243]